jgi:DNA polymerase elongation subunit (family B)
MGYQVVYGDTDSCFVGSTGHVRTDVHTATKILSCIFSHTPFPGMSMEVENRYSKIAFLGKKTYFGKVKDGPIISKGMSKSRKDDKEGWINAIIKELKALETTGTFTLMTGTPPAGRKLITSKLVLRYKPAANTTERIRRRE